MIDRSGSMYGKEISDARQALALMIRQLPVDCRFNIVSFGSKYQFLWPNGFRKYTHDSVAEALEYVDSMDANFGGTEILEALTAIFSIPCTTLRHVIVFTDWGVWDILLI